jgi:hypothetical protein
LVSFDSRLRRPRLQGAVLEVRYRQEQQKAGHHEGGTADGYSEKKDAELHGHRDLPFGVAPARSSFPILLANVGSATMVPRRREIFSAGRRVDIIGKVLRTLGAVEAPDEKSAIAEAAKEFHIAPARRNKIVVTRLDIDERTR